MTPEQRNASERLRTVTGIAGRHVPLAYSGTRRSASHRRRSPLAGAAGRWAAGSPAAPCRPPPSGRWCGGTRRAARRAVDTPKQLTSDELQILVGVVLLAISLGGLALLLVQPPQPRLSGPSASGVDPSGRSSVRRYRLPGPPPRPGRAQGRPRHLPHLPRVCLVSAWLLTVAMVWLVCLKLSTQGIPTGQPVEWPA